MSDVWLEDSSSSLSIIIKLKLWLWLSIQKSIFRLTPHKLNSVRLFLLNIFGANVKYSSFIHPTATIYMPWNFVLGKKSSIDFDVIIYNWDRVVIGDYVSIAYKSNINTASHDYQDPYFKLITKPIYIESGVFIGTESYISKGVTIKKLAVIGARSVVTKDMPESYVCIGHPCKAYKKREKVNNE